MAKPFQFSLKSLMILICCVSLLCTCSVSIYDSYTEWLGSDYGPYDNINNWPRSLVSLIDNDTNLVADVEPYRISDFIDHQSIWRIKPKSQLGKNLFEKNSITATNYSHPKVSFLIKSCPSEWGNFSWENFNWYSTPGYGFEHIEGLDLFLVAENPQTGEFIVLHEWIF